LPLGVNLQIDLFLIGERWFALAGLRCQLSGCAMVGCRFFKFTDQTTVMFARRQFDGLAVSSLLATVKECVC
jgi:hypothetical protein